LLQIVRVGSVRAWLSANPLPLPADDSYRAIPRQLRIAPELILRETPIYRVSRAGKGGPAICSVPTVLFEGLTNVTSGTCSSSEGETDLFIEDKTYFYYSDPGMAAWKVEHFKP
jgi:hypothetical protein